MNRAIITLVGSTRELAARQMLLTLNMNRVQNAISSTDIREILVTAQSRVNEVLIYKVPDQYSINSLQTANNHQQLINTYTPYTSKIIYTYGNFRPTHNDSRPPEEFCKRNGIDACWNPFSPVEKNDQMLIDILDLDAL
jgi:hypothetical protein